MHYSIRRVLAIVVVFASLTPVALLAQTPEPEPSFELTLIGVTNVGDSVATPSAQGEAGSGLMHVVQRLEVDPGAPVPVLNGMRSVVLSVQTGEMRVSTEDGTAVVSVGSGATIQMNDGSSVCDQSACDLEPGSPVVLGAGNGFSVTNGSLGIDVVGDEPAVVLVSVLVPGGSFGERCWICPGQ